MKKFKTINQVIQKGHLEVTLVSLLIMFGVPTLSYFALNFMVNMEFAVIGSLIGMIIGWIAAWLWWSFKIVKWRIWAFENVKKEEWSKLNKEAVEQLLTWPIGDKFEKTEFRSEKEDLIIKEINQEIKRQNAPVIETVDLEKIEDDLTIPYETQYFYNGREIKASLILFFVLILIGIYLIFENEIFYGIFSFLVSLKFFEWKKYKELKQLVPKLILNEKGIDMKFNEFGMIEWGNTEDITFLDLSKSLQLGVWKSDDDYYEVNFPLRELDIVNYDEMLRIINIYIKRYYEKVKLN